MDAGEPIEQFLILAKNQKSKALEQVLKQAISHAKIFVFSELLNLPNVQNLKGSGSQKYFATLELFAYGNYMMYKKNKANYLDLNVAQLDKLKMLSIVDMAANQKGIQYSTMQKELDLPNPRQMEEIILDSIYNGLISGKIDHKLKILQIDYTYGRDVRPEAAPQLIHNLENWHKQLELIEASLGGMMKDITRHIDQERHARAINDKKAEEVTQKIIEEKMKKPKGGIKLIGHGR